MHDTFLLSRISESLGELCRANSITRIIKLKIKTSRHSHVDNLNLLEQLQRDHIGIVGEWTEIIIERSDIADLIAVIESVEGERLE